MQNGSLIIVEWLNICLEPTLATRQKDLERARHYIGVVPYMTLKACPHECLIKVCIQSESSKFTFELSTPTRNA